MTKDEERMLSEGMQFRLLASGLVGLLCEVSTSITDPEQQEMLDAAVTEWCKLTGWTWQRTLDRVEVFPPEPKG